MNRSVFGAVGAIALWMLSGAAAAQERIALDPQGILSLLDASGGKATIRLHRATGAVRFVRVEPGALKLTGSTPESRAADFLTRHGTMMGVSHPATELSAPVIRQDSYGRTRVSFEQTYRGLPVFAGTLRVHFDDQQRLTAANGTFVPGIVIDPRPTWSPQTASARVIEDVLGRLPFVPTEPVEARSIRLMVFRSGLLQRIPGRDHLVYEVEVAGGPDVREFVYFDAHTGKIVERIAGIHDAL